MVIWRSVPFRIGSEIESFENRWHLVIDGVPIEAVQLESDFLQFSGLGQISDKEIGVKEKLTKILNLIESFDRKSAKKSRPSAFFGQDVEADETESPNPSR